MELRTPKRTPPVLVIKGTVENRKFEIVTRGITNYFRKETWGAAKGQSDLFGRRKSGGFVIEIRTKNFSGRWQQGWRGTRGGGGGGGLEIYEDDLLPGRFLWNTKGFIGAAGNYEYHDRANNVFPNIARWEEEFRNCSVEDGYVMPGRILWGHFSRGYPGVWYPIEQRVFRIHSFSFQDEPAEEWFESRIKEYFPPSAVFRPTNMEPKSVTQ